MPGVAAYVMSLWLGAYLLSRSTQKIHLLLAGLGLIAYALAVAAQVLGIVAEIGTADRLHRLSALLVLLPAVPWTGALLHLLPSSHLQRLWLVRLWSWLLLPLTLLIYVVGITTDVALTNRAAGAAPSLIYLLLAVVVLLPLVAAAFLTVSTLRSEERTKRSTGLLLVSLLFFTLSTGAVVLPLWGIPLSVKMAALGADLALLGYAIAALDAFEEGEALLPDMLQSLYSVLGLSILFGGQVALVMLIDAGTAPRNMALLLGVLASTVFLVTFAGPLQTLLDRIAFNGYPQLRKLRRDIRAVDSAVSRVDSQLHTDTLSEDDFIRYTRRAISHLGDLSRLASSPLTRLSLINARLRGRGAGFELLEWAVELQRLLTESIMRLRPATGEAYGVSDPWRHFNSLYYPYVLGLKPYTRRAVNEGMDETAQAVLDWFRMEVPERTLHNWQNAAAKLIALNLLEQCRISDSV